MDKKKEGTTLAVHRCRFVDYAPSAITALAFPPLPLPSIKGKKKKSDAANRTPKFGLLAVGHANGNIDICQWMGAPGEAQSSQSWVLQKTLSGPYPSKVDSLAFVIRYPDEVDEDDLPSQSNLRLFSSGGGSDLIEWDLEKSCIRRTISSQGGSIWSIAANPSSTTIALGCEDGSIRLLSVADDGLSHSRRFDRVKCHILSLAWGPPIPRKPTTKSKPKHTSTSDTDESGASDSDDDEDEWNDSFLISGGSDSSLRKWDVNHGRVVERMGVDKVRGERTLVWTVGVLGDGTIVSGDSLGVVKFWDPRTCTQLHSFKAHGADVLCMAISPEGKAVYTSGVDQKTVQFSLVKTSNPSNPTAPLAHTSQWTQTASRRMHSHDVRALAIWPPHTPLPPSLQHHRKRQFHLDVAPILASGGLDMSVVLTPAALPTSTIVKVINPLSTSVEATFEEAYHRKLGYIPQGAVKVSRGARLVSCAREAGITIWRIQRKQEGASGDEAELGAPIPVSVVGGKAKKGGKKDVPEVLQEVEPDPAGGWELVLEMELAVRSNIVDHEISDDGRWLVVSDLYETKLFALSQEDDDEKLSIKRVKDFSSILQAHIPSTSSTSPAFTGGRTFKFSPDASKLVIAVALTPYVLVVDLTGEKPKVLRRFDHHRMQDVAPRVIKGQRATTKDLSSEHSNEDVDMADATSDVEKDKGDDKEKSGSDVESDEDMVVEGSAFGRGSTVHVDINRLAISADGQWLASSDSRSRTHIFNLDSISHHTTLPTFHRPAQSLTFDPSHPSVLLLAFPDNTVQIYDVETRQFPAWGKELSASLPRKFTAAHETLLGVSFEPPSSLSPSSPSSLATPAKPATGKERRKSLAGAEKEKEESKGSKYLLFWSATWLFKMSLDPTRRSVGGGGKKRRRGATATATTNGGAQVPVTPLRPIGSSNLPPETPDAATLMAQHGIMGGEHDDSRQWWDSKMVTQYRPIACCDFLDRDELVVVERPLTDVLATLPPPYFKHKYGAS